MGSEPRLLSRMAAHILEAQHERATQDFCQLLREGAAPLELEREALHTASPFLNIPAHVMVKPDGELRSVNYDHTILGVWRSLRMSTLMPKGYEYLPHAQALWYLPQGLDVWSQVQCEFPGHYAREQEKCPTINLKGPIQHFEEYPPLVEGSFEERLGLFFHSIVQGDKVTAFRTFLGLADEAVHDDVRRQALEAQVLMAGIVDLPGPRQRVGLLVNPAHKAIRARAMIDIANALGWERAYPAFFIVIPDLANNPRNHDMFEISHQLLRAAFGPEYHAMRRTNTAPLDEAEAEAFIAVLHEGTPDETLAAVTELLRQGKSLVAINDAAVIAATRLMATIENPGMTSGFTQADHCIDYTNVVGFWLRRYDHPQQIKAPYYAAHHVNDTARFLREKAPKDPAAALPARPEEHAAHVERLSLKQTLAELGRACNVQDAPLATALLDGYLQRTPERQRLVETLVFEAAKIEGDPHIPRLAMTHHEEYLHSTLPAAMRDDLFRSWTRYLSRCRRRSDRFDCVQVYEDTLSPSA